MLTRNQIIHLYSTGREAGMTHDEIKQELAACYGVTTSRDLSVAQYREYVTHLQQQKIEQAPRRAVTTDGKPAQGYLTSYAMLQEYVAGALQFGRLWPGQVTSEDAECLAFLLDKFRLYRVRDKRLSRHQVDAMVTKIAQFPLAVFRRSYVAYVDKHQGKPEEYFIGIMAHQCRDERRQQDAFTRDLALT